VAQLDAALQGRSRLRALPGRPHEVVLAVGALRVVPLLVVIAVVPASLVRGPVGAGTAAFVLAIVVGLFALSAWAHAWAAQRGLGALQAVALGGLFARLWLYAVALALFRDVLDPLVLAIVTPIVVFTLLAYEVRLVSSRPEFSFVDTSVRPGSDRKDRS
jgi:hypothetical protein